MLLKFKEDTAGLWYEGRCVRGHLKDCALQVAKFYDGTSANKEAGFPTIKNFRSKFVNAVYVDELKIPVMRGGERVTKADESVERFIQVMTRQGPRSSIKYVDCVNESVITCTLNVQKGQREIGLSEIESVLEYGEVHGMGAERSQQWGRYTWTIVNKV